MSSPSCHGLGLGGGGATVWPVAELAVSAAWALATYWVELLAAAAASGGGVAAGGVVGVLAGTCAAAVAVGVAGVAKVSPKAAAASARTTLSERLACACLRRLVVACRGISGRNPRNCSSERPSYLSHLRKHAGSR